MHCAYTQATRLQSTDQTAVLVYADVGSTLSRNPKANTNVSLQLDDDCVQYADLKHHQTSEIHQRECNSHTGMLPQPSYHLCYLCTTNNRHSS